MSVGKQDQRWTVSRSATSLPGGGMWGGLPEHRAELGVRSKGRSSCGGDDQQTQSGESGEASRHARPGEGGVSSNPVLTSNQSTLPGPNAHSQDV